MSITTYIICNKNKKNDCPFRNPKNGKEFSINMNNNILFLHNTKMIFHILKYLKPPIVYELTKFKEFKSYEDRYKSVLKLDNDWNYINMKFYDITDIYRELDDDEAYVNAKCITDEMLEEMNKKYGGWGNLIKKHINENDKFNDGDILFVGDTYESRPDYGFAIVNKEKSHKFDSTESFYYIEYWGDLDNIKKTCEEVYEESFKKKTTFDYTNATKTISEWSFDMGWE